MLRYGYRRAAVEDVARALHISKKTIYDLFAGKKELYRYSVELWATEQRRRVESMLTATSALGRVAEVTAIACADARRGYESSPFHFADEPPEILAEVNAKVFGPMVRDFIEQGNRSGELHVEDPELTAAFGVAIGMEAVRMMREDPTSHPEEAALDAVRRLLAGVVK